MKTVHSVLMLCVFLGGIFSGPRVGAQEIVRRDEMSCNFDYAIYSKINTEVRALAASNSVQAQRYIEKLVTRLSYCLENGKRSHFMPCDFNSIRADKVHWLMYLVSAALNPYRDSLRSYLSHQQVVLLQHATWGYLNYWAGAMNACFQEPYLRQITIETFPRIEEILRLLSGSGARNPMGPVIFPSSVFVHRWSLGRDPDETVVLSLNGISLIHDERSSGFCIRHEPYSRVFECARR